MPNELEDDKDHQFQPKHFIFVRPSAPRITFAWRVWNWEQVSLAFHIEGLADHLQWYPGNPVVEGFGTTFMICNRLMPTKLQHWLSHITR